MGTPRSEIHKSGPDNSVEFGQEALAEDIADQISRDHNTHVAVNGPWGSGKTTVLKHAEEQIENENSEVITHWYEPWRYGPDQTTLRRTFLKTLDEKVASELNNEPLLKTERYYFQNVEFEPKNIGEYARDFWRTLQAHSYFIVGFTLIVTFLFAAGSWAVATASSGIGFVIGNALSATALFLFSILIVYMRSDLASELAAQATFDVKEPKISEIDLFEDQYEKLLDRAGKENKRIVVFIDDVDRCDSEEIREVITGLSTYLNPDHDNADVAFVAAIDGPKILESFEPEKKSNGLRTNILNKTFQVILPVPSVSRDNVIKLVEKTTEDLDYTVSDDDIERISSISVTHANSNLRIIRSALCEVQWMSDLGADYLEDFGYEESKSFQRILNSDFNLYRIALIKLLSDDEDLRRLVTDASVWLGENDLTHVEWKLFELQPKFEPNGLDPRPFLGLNSPNEYVSSVFDFSDIKSDVKRGNLDNAKEKWKKYDEAARLDIAFNLLDIDWSSADLKNKSNILESVRTLLLQSQSILSAKRFDIFSRCIEEYDNDKEIINKHSVGYADWLVIADKIGEEALDLFIQKDRSFFKNDKRTFLKQLCVESPTYGSRVIDRVFEIEIHETKRNTTRSVNRTKRIFKKDIISESKKAPEYLLAVLENWDFDTNEDGPPDYLINENVIKKLDSSEYKQRAETMYSAEIPAGDFKRKLKETGWPIPREVKKENEEVA